MRIRPGARARSRGALHARACRASGALDRARDPAPAWPHRRAGRAARGRSSASRSARPTSCGRWTSRAGSRLASGRRCHPLTVRRRSFALSPCASKPAPTSRRGTVSARLERVFRRYGLPEAFFVDNGKPWGDCPATALDQALASGCSSSASRSSHAGPIIPQSRGKNERFHRTLKAEVLALQDASATSTDVQRAFDAWRDDLQSRPPAPGARSADVPASRYRRQPAIHAGPACPADYDDGEIVRSGLDHQGTTSASRAGSGRFRKPSRRTRRHPPALSRRHLRRLLRSPPDRNDRLDQQRKCVDHVSEQVSAMSPG